MTDIADIVTIYEGSNGEATMALYGRLKLCGPAGEIALNLFRACKCSARAKLYRGGNGKGSYRAQAYERKQWSMDNLCKALLKDAAGLGWGWGEDAALKERNDPNYHVLYIDTPMGQVSFHNGARLAGPDYQKQWDGIRGASVDRICRWVCDILKKSERRDAA